MSKKIDERLPKNSGQGVVTEYPAIRSPWGKLVSFQEAMHYVSRYDAVMSAVVMQAFRILLPDYEQRAQKMCVSAYNRLEQIQKMYGKYSMLEHNVHPFCRGNFVGALTGDSGDDALLMCGRVQDFGTYRAEKELDICDWDIVGSDLCRATTQSLQACADVWATNLRPSKSHLEYHMVEAKGCGDLHCRIVAESREKYPMPPHQQWECFGPVATAEQIKFTPEEECIKESMVFREECDYTFANGTNWERDSSSVAMVRMTNAASGYIFPTMMELIQDGTLDEKFTDHVLHCLFEAAGKAAFGEAYAKKGLLQWLGVPAGIDDGRIMGGHIEMYLQALGCEYEIEAFNEKEVIYVIDRKALSFGFDKFVTAHVSYWYGMTKTLVNAQWSLWEESQDTPADKLRIKIAKKIDKFC